MLEFVFLEICNNQPEEGEKAPEAGRTGECTGAGAGGEQRSRRGESGHGDDLDEGGLDDDFDFDPTTTMAVHPRQSTLEFVFLEIYNNQPEEEEAPEAGRT